jgi:hypothetical protein
MSIAVGDVNGDSQPDIVVANSGIVKVGVLRNGGNGTFLAQVTYTAGTTPYAVAVADVNSDNKLDIVVVNSGSTTVGVFINTGTGTFLAQVTYSTGAASTPRSVAVADVNSDNKPDIVVANSGTVNVGVFLNAGTGTFLAQTNYSTGAGSGPRSVVVTDVNSDNKPDIIVANTGSSTVGVLLNAGTGTFLAQTTYTTGAGSSPYGVAVGDVNSDNKPDIVVANSAAATVGVLLNGGNGTFLAQVTYSTGGGSAPRSVAVADVNGDSNPDIIVGNLGSDTVGVLLNTGTGTFLAQTTYSTGASSSPLSVVVTDVNGDNEPDVVVANSGSLNVGVFLHC